MLMRNPVSLAGVALAIVSLANIFLFVIIDAIAVKPSPYIGILAYMVSPAFLILGLLIMLGGVLLERRKKVAPTAFYPRVDLNDPTQRSAVISFMTFLIVFVMVSVMGSYKAYEFTESVSFCGQLCHTVMSPEYTAYQLSPHARVACAECHVGAGATWFVKSKLSGSRQVFAAIFNTFPRPIPTPVHNLRPAQETCEQCHWPKKFYGGLFDWTITDMPMGGMPYSIAALGDKQVGGITPLSEEAKKMGAPPNWLSYVAVDDAAASAKKVAALGGKVLFGPLDVGPGKMAIAADPTGAATSTSTRTTRRSCSSPASRECRRHTR